MPDFGALACLVHVTVETGAGWRGCPRVRRGEEGLDMLMQRASVALEGQGILRSGLLTCGGYLGGAPIGVRRHGGSLELQQPDEGGHCLHLTRSTFHRLLP